MKRFFEAISDCFGCGNCELVCPKNAITFEQDDLGNCYPIISDDVCIGCKRCVKNCPALNPVPTHEFLASYAGWSMLYRKESSSGGLFSVFASKVLQSGGVVYGATSKGINVFHVRIDSKADLFKLRGSKYVNSILANIFFQVEKDLNLGIPVLFTGVACQIAALYSYLNRDYSNLVTVEVLCKGNISNLLFESYLFKLRRELSIEDIQEVQFRYLPSSRYLFRVYDGVRWIIVPKRLNSYMWSFNNSSTFRDSCYKCAFKRIERVSDLSLGDYHPTKRFLHDMTAGCSLVLANTQKGVSYISDILKSNDLKLFALSKQETILSSKCLRTSMDCHHRRKEICSDILNPHFDLSSFAVKYGLKDSLLSSMRYSILGIKFLDLIKTIINYLR